MTTKKQSKILSGVALTACLFRPVSVHAAGLNDVSRGITDLINSGQSGNSSQIVNVFVMMTILSVVPLLLVMMTSFTRIIMVLSFTRSALGTQQNPPNQVLLGLALFLTLFTMKPVYTDIYKEAIQPYSRQEITEKQAFNRSEVRLKEFMGKETRKKDVKLFLDVSKDKHRYKNVESVPLTTLTPAFIISELRTAFSIGFLIFIPFLIIDMVVSSVLMAMGMIMLSPVMISLPFKLLLFVMVDGWYLLVESLVHSFS